MSDAPQQPTSDVRIDRLVLDIPGLDPADARLLARAVGEGLAQSGAAAEHRAISLQLSISDETPEMMAAKIEAALRERL